MNTTWRVIIITVIVLLAIIKISRYVSKSDGNAQIISEYYEREWHYDGEAYEQVIVNALKNNGYFYDSYYIKKDLRSNGKALIAGTDDGINFKYFDYDDSRSTSVMPVVDNGIPKPKSP